MIITLCGSARFEDQFRELDERLTLKGHTVFNLAVYPRDKNGEKNWYTDEVKEKLDRAHKRKIFASDAIVVINFNGYVGESTQSEIWYALQNGKKVFCTDRYHTSLKIGKTANIQMHPICWYKGCKDPLLNTPPCALCYE